MEAYILCQLQEDSPNVFYMSGLHAQQIFNRKKMPYLELRDADLINANFILIPLLINDNHWTVVLISNLTDTVKYINPFGTSDKALSDILEKWKKFCSTRSSELKSKKWTSEQLDHEIQLDLVSCGIFIMVFMEKFINYDYNYYFDSSKTGLKKLRENFHKTLRDKSTI